MKNKSSFRLVAWLVALVMILNMMPLTAFAVDKPSNPAFSPDIGKELGYTIIGNLPEETPPDRSVGDFTIKYVIQGEYTYSGSDLLLDSYTRTVTDGSNPYRINPDSIEDCSVDANSRVWDSESNTLIFYPIPDTRTIELRYMVAYYKNGKLDIKTFNGISGANSEGGLQKDPNESIDIRDFTKSVNGSSTDKL